MANHLIVHCGGKHVNREKIEQAPIPQRTKSWVPIPHYRLLNQVDSTLEEQGFRIVNEAHAVWGVQGERYFGLLELQNGKLTTITLWLLDPVTVTKKSSRPVCLVATRSSSATT